MNLIRTHYPQDEIHYRIADEIGIMYMIEVPINWWFPTDEETFED
jgi:beta-galactosidase/beta-glucuronidase